MVARSGEARGNTAMQRRKSMGRPDMRRATSRRMVPRPSSISAIVHCGLSSRRPLYRFVIDLPHVNGLADPHPGPRRFGDKVASSAIAGRVAGEVICDHPCAWRPSGNPARQLLVHHEPVAGHDRETADLVASAPQADVSRAVPLERAEFLDDDARRDAAVPRALFFHLGKIEALVHLEKSLDY